MRPVQERPHAPKIVLSERCGTEGVWAFNILLAMLRRVIRSQRMVHTWYIVHAPPLENTVLEGGTMKCLKPFDRIFASSSYVHIM